MMQSVSDVLTRVLTAVGHLVFIALPSGVADHILTWLIAVPMLAAVAILFMPRSSSSLLRNFSTGAMLVEFRLSLFLLSGNFSRPDFVFLEGEPSNWIHSLGIGYVVGVDGISLWLILLTTAMTPIALYASWSTIDTKIKEYAFSFLILEASMLGAFLALDLFLFYVFWELMLVPMYLIIGIWGGKNRVYAATKFFLYTMVGSVLMLIAILYLVHAYAELSGGTMTFDLRELHRLVLPANVQIWLFLAFALAFAIKVPLFPVHTWLPDAHTQAPTGGSVVLAAVMLKLGVYGLLRFALPLFPLISHIIGPTFAGLGVAGIIWGAYCAWVQKDIKKLVAYSSVSHMGFVVLGLFSLTEHGVSGSILQMVNHGVSTGALFLLVGVIYERRHTRDLDAFGGLVKSMPWYTVVFVIVTLSSIGLPGTNGFVGEFMILTGTFTSVALAEFAPIETLLATTGVIFAAVYMLHAVLKMFWGPVKHPENENLPDLNRREIRMLAPLLVLIFWIGVHPSTFLEPMTPAVDHFMQDQHRRFLAAYRNEGPRLLDPSQIGYAERPALESDSEPVQVAMKDQHVR